MNNEAYYPDLLESQKIKINSYSNLILKCIKEISLVDGILRYNPEKNIIKAFLRAEEVLTSSSLEVRELSFDEYLDNLFEKTGYGADDLVEMKFMINYYSEIFSISKERGFSLSLLNEINQKLLKHRNRRKLTFKKMHRERQPWLHANTDQFDWKLYMFKDDDKIEKLMGDLAVFIRNSKHHPIITAAIAYAQLVMIHPWRYFNGRTTGALIPLLFNFLELTTERSFFISSPFAMKKEKYYKKVTQLFQENTWDEWIEFFLINIRNQAVNYQKKNRTYY
ncbi:MAG: Fic family protein [Candidatus Woesearchaeota archaeon]